MTAVVTCTEADREEIARVPTEDLLVYIREIVARGDREAFAPWLAAIHAELDSRELAAIEEECVTY